MLKDHLFTEDEVERTTVGQEGRGGETIADQLNLVDLVVLVLLSPTLLLRAKTGDELRSSVELALHLSLTLEENVELILLYLLLSVERLKLSLDLS